MSLYSLYFILFLTFIVVFIVGFLFVSCCKDTTFLRYFRSLSIQILQWVADSQRLGCAR